MARASSSINAARLSPCRWRSGAGRSKGDHLINIPGDRETSFKPPGILVPLKGIQPPCAKIYAIDLPKLRSVSFGFRSESEYFGKILNLGSFKRRV